MTAKQEFVLVFRANASDAIAKTNEVANSTAAIGDASVKAAAAAGTYAQAAGGAGAAAKKAGDGARFFGDQTAASAKSTSNASGQLGYLVAQFNDLAVMMAAGQNPLQLAMQQGTQITQVIGPMGAGGAVRALGSAFMGMLSPINLVTIGAIAAGGAVVNWLSSATDDAGTLTAAVDDLRAGIQEFADLEAEAALPIEKLAEKYGRYAAAVEQWQRTRAQGAGELSGKNIDSFLSDMPATVEANVMSDDTDGIAWRALMANADARVSTQAVRDAVGVDEQIAAITDLLAAYERIADASGARSESERGYIAQLEEARLLLAQQAALEDKLAANPLSAQQSQGYETYQQTRAASAEAQADAQKMLASLQEENALRAASVRYGADSAQVADLRAAAERRAYEEQVSALEVSDSLKGELLAAYDAGASLASLDIGAGIRSAESSAAGLLSQLNAALAASANLAAAGSNALDESKAKWKYRDDPVGLARAQAGIRFDNTVDIPETKGRNPARSAIIQQRAKVMDDAEEKARLDQQYSEYVSTRAKATRAAAGGGGGGGGSRAQTQQRDAVADLIAREKQQIAVLQQLDPVQAQIAKNHRVLSGATDAERAEVEKLIRERAGLEKVRDGLDEIGQTGGQAFSQLVTGSASLGDALGMLVNKLAEMAASSAWDMLIGGGGGGGGSLISSAWGAVTSFLSFADGGKITGAGGPRDDAILARVSAGEFIVNAAATASNLPLLEAINAGRASATTPRLPAYADGGIVGIGARAAASAASSAASAPDQTASISMPINIDARGAQRGVAEEVAAQMLKLMPALEKRAVAAVARNARLGRS